MIQIQWKGTVCHWGKASMATAQATQNAAHASSPLWSRLKDIAQVAHRADRPAADLSRGSNAHDIMGVAAIIGVQATAYKLLYGENQYKLPGDVI